MREYENITVQKPQSAEADTTRAQSAVAEPDMPGQGPLQDQILPTQPLSPGGSFGTDILNAYTGAAASHAYA